MEDTHKIMLMVALTSTSLALLLLITTTLICICKRNHSRNKSWDNKESSFEVEETMITEEMIKFEGGEDLTCFNVLDAPGEVIGKSSFGTLYKANLVTSNTIVVLRFLRPACTRRVQDVMHAVRVLGSVRHPNLVPLCGTYVGPRGEKLMVHPFYRRGNLAEFIRDGNGEAQKWSVIYRISSGIARGLNHLHTSLQKPIIHGNLKSKNILLGRNHTPLVSDFGLHMLLNPSTIQEMIEDAAVEGYKPPELIKINDTSVETDIFNFGVILLELLTGKEPNEKPNRNQDFNSNSMLDHRIFGPVDKDDILKLYRLAMACCSPLPSFRPDIKYICKKLQEIES
ncbi:putative kinase-like protein TMKL1 [Bidens hawaiensis]|uniref:putative kinase-like protein TMKL1 n=1 Tax=Bidens hawaiensis TaxID=980011 RepID=UPI0040490771